MTEISPRPDIYQQILTYTANLKSNYNHAVNTSVFSTLFALGCGVEDVEPLAIAGLLHDIGLANLPSGLLETDPAYQEHVWQGIKLLETKKIVGGEEVKLLISLHHERMDGQGYPLKLQKKEITVPARILQIADELDRLTSVTEMKTPMTPLQAIDHMLKTNSDEKGAEKFDRELLLSLQKLVTPPDTLKMNREVIEDKFSTPVKMPPNANSIDMKDTKRRKRFKRPA